MPLTIASNMVWTMMSFNCRYPFMRVHASHGPYGYPLFMLQPWQQAHENP